MSTVRVVLADDQTVVREGLRALLTALPSLEVVGVAADAESALELVEQLTPDVLLTDLRMPGIGGVEGIRRLVASGSTTRAVALTTYDDDATIRDALHAGAVGFLTKDADPDAIEAAIVAAAQGRSVLEPQALAALLSGPTAAPRSPDAPDGLSVREIEVLRLVARGLSNQQIARELVVSLATVKTHINHLLAKTACRDRAGLVGFAYQHRITD